ncbi:MAG: hypothetical protein WCD38_13250 [Candidatus Tumulicola sp.]
MTRLRRIFAVTCALLSVALVAAGPTIAVTGQLLAYQDGFVFFTTGDGFRVAPGVLIRDSAGTGPATIVPEPRVWARAHFDATGTVTELDLSRSPLPAEGSFADVARFAVALSSPIPNPDLVPATPAPGHTLVPAQHFSGRPVLVTFTVQVPPTTPFSASVYITTDASGWNAQAIPMDRIDTLHYQITRRLNSGTIFRYLYDRGSFQSQEIAQNGLQRTPREIVVTDADVRTLRDTVYAWLDSSSNASGQQPNGLPTPYNPNPFPNLPSGFPSPGIPTPHPHPPA